MKLINIQHTINLLQGKWKIPILTTLFQLEKARYSVLQNQINPIGSKMLTSELKRLEELNLIEKTLNSSSIIEYKLSKKGASLYEVFQILNDWAEKQLPIQKESLECKHTLNHTLTINI